MTRPRLTFIGLFSLLLLAATPLPPPTPSLGEPGQPEERQTEGDATDPASHGSIASQLMTTPPLTNSPSTKREADNCGQQCDHEASANGWLAVFTGALVFVGVLQFITLAYQATYTQQAMELTQQSLALTKQQADTLDKTFRLQQRPWLVPTGKIPVGEWEGLEGIPVDLEIRLRNAGSIPAIKVTMTLQLATSQWSDPPPSGLTPAKALPPTSQEVERSVSMVGPGVTHAFFVSLSGPRLTTIVKSMRERERTAKVWVYGMVEYWDRPSLDKGGEEPFTTQFCFWWNPRREKFYQGGTYNDCT